MYIAVDKEVVFFYVKKVLVDIFYENICFKYATDCYFLRKVRNNNYLKLCTGNVICTLAV